MERVLVALTPLPEVFAEAEEKGADFLLFHHPLIFDAIRSLDTSLLSRGSSHQGHRERMAVYAAHTSYDAAPGGVSVALAEASACGVLCVSSRRGGRCESWCLRARGEPSMAWCWRSRGPGPG